jgi:hypothetical protein
LGVSNLKVVDFLKIRSGSEGSALAEQDIATMTMNIAAISRIRFILLCLTMRGGA